MIGRLASSYIEDHPEAAIVLMAARPRVHPEAVEKIRSTLLSDVDWQHLRQLALHHGVASLVHRSLSATCREAIPDAEFHALVLADRAAQLQNQFLAEELVRILRRLDACGLRAVPVKGPMLSYVVYGDKGLRSTRDLDLLVRKEDVLPIKEILLEDGFRLLKPNSFSGAGGDDFERYHELTFGKTSEGVFVEVQWAARNSRFHSRLDFGAYWDRLTRVVFEGVDVESLRREDLLVLLCEHGTKHFWNRLKWTCDIAELVSGEGGLDWEDVFEHARVVGAERAVLLGLALSRDLLGSDLPDSVKTRIDADPAAASLTAQVARRLFSRRSDDFGMFSWKKCLFHARSRERASDQAGHATRFIQFLASPIGIGDANQRQESASDYFFLPARVIRRVGRHLRARDRSRPTAVHGFGHQR